LGTKSPFREVADLVQECGGEALAKCYQCGTCSASCPWRDYLTFLPRRMFQEGRLGLTDFESDSLWRCVTCNKCVQRCPRGVPIIDLMKALRRSVIGMGIAEPPTALSSALRNLSAAGNPLGEASEDRNGWAQGLDIKPFDPVTEYLFFPCCYTAFDPAMKDVGRATAKVLTTAGVNFGILDGLVCCGESARKSGDEELFKQLASGNIGVLIETGVKKIIVNSPHCYYTFVNEYPELNGWFEVIHTSQFISRLIGEGRLPFKNALTGKATYQDPCYLGRHSEIYDEPRSVISATGAELVEMETAKDDALCCGGGGGRIWMETPRNERFCEERVKQAAATGAETLVTACPYCLSNFKDSTLNQGFSETLSVIDISELVARAL
jgi:Fe-S oxidoreductase